MKKLRRIMMLPAILIICFLLSDSAYADMAADFGELGDYDAIIANPEGAGEFAYGEMVHVDYEYREEGIDYVYVHKGYKSGELFRSDILPSEYDLSGLVPLDPEAPGFTIATTDVYSGPGQAYPVSYVIPEGTEFKVKYTLNLMAYVEGDSFAGWVIIERAEDYATRGASYIPTVMYAMNEQRMVMKDTQLFDASGNGTDMVIPRGTTVNITGKYRRLRTEGIAFYVYRITMDSASFYIDDDCFPGYANAPHGYPGSGYAALDDISKIEFFSTDNMSKVEVAIPQKRIVCPKSFYSAGYANYILVNIDGTDYWVSGYTGIDDVEMDYYFYEPMAADDTPVYDSPYLESIMGTIPAGEELRILYEYEFPSDGTNEPVKLYYIIGESAEGWTYQSNVFFNDPEGRGTHIYGGYNDEVEEPEVEESETIEEPAASVSVSVSVSVSEKVSEPAEEEKPNSEIQPSEEKITKKSAKMTVIYCVVLAVAISGLTAFVICRLYKKKQGEKNEQTDSEE